MKWSRAAAGLYRSADGLAEIVKIGTWGIRPANPTTHPSAPTFPTLLAAQAWYETNQWVPDPNDDPPVWNPGLRVQVSGNWEGRNTPHVGQEGVVTWCLQVPGGAAQYPIVVLLDGPDDDHIAFWPDELDPLVLPTE